MRRTGHWVLSGLLIVSIPNFGLAQQTGLAIENAWSRAAMAGRTGVVYLTITDTGAPDRLTSVASPVATTATLHESFTERGVAKMRDVAALPVEPGKPVTLAPGGYHIMLMGLKRPLKPGDAFPVTLNFEKAGEVTASVTVRMPGGMAGHDSMGGMPMQGMPMHGPGTTAKPQ